MAKQTKSAEAMTDEELLEQIKDPAVRELLKRKQPKLAQAIRHPLADPRNKDPRFTDRL